MPTDPRWLRCDPDLGVALWLTLREQLGKTVGVGATCTNDDYVMTEVWTRADDIPLLRCESRYTVTTDAEGRPVRDAGEHTYYLPTCGV